MDILHLTCPDSERLLEGPLLGRILTNTQDRKIYSGPFTHDQSITLHDQLRQPLCVSGWQ
jgi:hypothetical protein